MKKIILSLILGSTCTLAFATKGIAISINSRKNIINSLTYSCTETRSKAVVINGKYVTTVSATETFTSNDPSFTCSIAGAMAQSSAQKKADEYARKAGALPEIPN